MNAKFQRAAGHKRCGFDPWLGRSPGGGHGSPLSIPAWRIPWTELYNIVQEAVIKTIPKKKKCKKAKCLSEEGLKQVKGEKIYSSECRVPKNSKER